MASIPMLKFPYLSQEAIIMQMELSERISLSWTSKRAEFMIRCAIGRFPAGIAVRVNEENINLDVSMGTQKVQCQLAYRPQLNNAQLVTIGGVRLQVEEIETGKFVMTAPRGARNRVDYCLKSLEKLLEQFKRVLKVEKFDLVLKANPVLPKLCQHLKCVEKFDEIWIGGGNSGLKVRQRDLDIVLENLKAQKMTIEINPTREVIRYRSRQGQALSIDQLNIREAFWVDFENMPSVKNVSVSSRSRLGSFLARENANEFIKAWLNGKNEVTEKITFAISFYENYYGPVYEGVETMVTEMTLQEMMDVHSNVHEEDNRLRQSRDIIRTTDGQRATVICTSEDVSIVVWTEDNLKKMKRIP